MEVYSEKMWECSENVGFIFGAYKLAACCVGSSGRDTVSKTHPEVTLEDTKKTAISSEMRYVKITKQ